MTTPLVSVVCLCYNHERFVKEAIESVFNQTYSPIQLIVIDDASTDASALKIREVLKDHPGVIFIALNKNLGNTKAFNKALPLLQGEYVIDLAADDALLPDRVEKGVKQLQSSGKEYGIHFSDAENISEEGMHLSFHSDRFPHNTIPVGNIYEDIIRKYFISPPSVMIRKEALEELNGYDENLAYEDFDLWIRTARNFKFTYSHEVLVKKRQVSSSLGNQQFKRSSKQLYSTYLICRKILEMNRSESERKALSSRLIYETGMSLKLFRISLAWNYFKLWITNLFKRY